MHQLQVPITDVVTSQVFPVRKKTYWELEVKRHRLRQSMEIVINHNNVEALMEWAMV